MGQTLLLEIARSSLALWGEDFPGLASTPLPFTSSLEVRLDSSERRARCTIRFVLRQTRFGSC
jgi:hypothetical protein